MMLHDLVAVEEDLVNTLWYLVPTVLCQEEPVGVITILFHFVWVDLLEAGQDSQDGVESEEHLKKFILINPTNDLTIPLWQ